VAGEIADATLNALLREPPEENRPAAPLSNEVASSRNPALPGELLGAWAGVVNTHKRNVPVTLWFQASGEVGVKLNDQPATLINEPRLDKGTFTGRMQGDIGTADANRRPYHLDWDITLRQGVLKGTLNVVGRHPSRGVGLGYWVELRRRC
jgi:hypothetical protein